MTLTNQHTASLGHSDWVQRRPSHPRQSKQSESEDFCRHSGSPASFPSREKRPVAISLSQPIAEEFQHVEVDL